MFNFLFCKKEESLINISFMKQQIRELLVTAKVAQHWEGHFEERVDELMTLVSKVDTDKNIRHAGELLDVYKKLRHKPLKAKRKKMADSEKPFEFLVFRN
jgi:hypothetical protein